MWLCMATSEKNSVRDVTIVGGGAAGLAAAIFTAEGLRESSPQAPRVLIVDGAARLGAKILVSGGGRCNVTHDVVSPDDFNGPRNIVRNVLAAFGVQKTVEWFKSIGVDLKREQTGKLFPTSDSAKTVLAALMTRCEELGVEIRTGFRVRSIGVAPQPSLARNFTLVADENQSLHSRCVILATGGRSLPRSGSDGGGWQIAQSLGHSVTKTYPALVPLVLDPKMFHAELSGISLEVELSTFAANKRIDLRCGSLLFTHFGISGPVVMDTSRHWVIAREQALSPRMKCNFLPGQDFESIERWLIDRGASNPKSQLLTTLSMRLPERVAAVILKHLDINPVLPIGQLSREARRTLVHSLVGLDLNVTGDRGWNYAEVTAGGVPLGEIDHRTMESRKVRGLYLVGEMLDCEGRIGGFNFQWAWATGRLAGRAVACRDDSTAND